MKSLTDWVVPMGAAIATLLVAIGGLLAIIFKNNNDGKEINAKVQLTNVEGERVDIEAAKTDHAITMDWVKIASDLRREIDLLRAEIGAVRTECFAAVAVKDAEIASLRKQELEATGERADLRNQLAEVHRELKNRSERIQELEAKNSELRREVDYLTSQLAQVQMNAEKVAGERVTATAKAGDYERR